MKKISSLILALLLILPLVVSCNGGYDTAPKEGIWESATIGKGDKTFTLEIVTEDKSVTHTIKTDKKTVGEALVELDFISGDEGPYGLYIKTVNGITVDYDKDGKYWAFYVNGEYAMSGVDTTEIDKNAKYELKVE